MFCQQCGTQIEDGFIGYFGAEIKTNNGNLL